MDLILCSSSSSIEMSFFWVSGPLCSIFFKTLQPKKQISISLNIYLCVNANFGESIDLFFWVSGPLGIFESDYVVDSTWWIIFCENNEAYHLIKDFSIARIPQCSFLFCSFIGTIEKVSWEYIHSLHHILPKALRKYRDICF